MLQEEDIERKGEIFRELDSLKIANNLLEGVLSTVRERLIPVLSVKPQGELKEEEKADLCSLAMEIKAQRRRVEIRKNDLDSLLSEIEL